MLIACPSASLHMNESSFPNSYIKYLTGITLIILVLRTCYAYKWLL